MDKALVYRTRDSGFDPQRSRSFFELPIFHWEVIPSTTEKQTYRVDNSSPKLFFQFPISLSPYCSSARYWSPQLIAFSTPRPNLRAWSTFPSLPTWKGNFETPQVSSTSAPNDAKFIRKPMDGLCMLNDKVHQLHAKYKAMSWDLLSAFIPGCNFPCLQNMIHDILHTHSVFHLHAVERCLHPWFQ